MPSSRSFRSFTPFKYPPSFIHTKKKQNKSALGCLENERFFVSLLFFFFLFFLIEVILLKKKKK